MKKIGIVICNYNKCEYVLKCIQSVLESKIQDFDIYVVDNASTDHSPERIKEVYKDRVTLLINQENLGGSGGFNTGIRRVIESGYEYLLCLDNDVQIDENAIEALYGFLEEHPEVGMVGSKVYHLDSPDYIQQFGLNINFDQFCAETLYADTLDSEDIPEVVYCDTVAACCVMLPVKVVKEVGSLPEDNFIYWDDMEWGYSVKQAGYKVAAYGKSMALHKMGAINKLNSSFLTYYHWRNSLNFFMKYTPNEKLEKMSVKLLCSMFYEIYKNMYCGQHSLAQTILFAYQDAIAGVRGKAKEGKIIPCTSQDSVFNKLLCKTNTYWMEEEDTLLREYIHKINPEAKEEKMKDRAELRIKKCSNIMELKDYSLQYCYIDEDLNIALNSEDIETIKNYPYSLQLFLYLNQTQFLYAAKQIKGDRAPADRMKEPTFSLK